MVDLNEGASIARQLHVPEGYSNRVENTLRERGKRYGDFADHARVAQTIKRAFDDKASNYNDLPDMHRQALEVIADKIARILTGDFQYADNWHDIQGYAKLVEDRLPQ